MNNSRRAAVFVLMRWLATKEFPQKLLSTVEDRSFVQDMVYTSVRRLRPLRAILGEFVKKWPKGELEALLYIGAAQILYMEDVPDFAAVNETVAAAHLSSNPSVAKVVNGVLRNIIRNRAQIEQKLKASPAEVRESFPTPLYRRWVEKFGEESAAEICAQTNKPALTYLARKDGSFSSLERGVRVEDVAGYQEGEFIVQDPATAAAVELMDVSSNQDVLDYCAAPGGKSVQMSWRGANVTACEVNPRRRQVLEENIRRTKLNIKTVGSPNELKGRLFDAVLVDAPCSNTGVLRRRPDARWNWNERKLAELVEIQGEILDTASSFVKSGGKLVYSTCSLETEENLGAVEKFLKKHTEFSLASYKELTPLMTGSDGAFAALLIKE
ncbi:MAG: hypothetical protein J6S51_05210 [Kiritimatiellae bacterium]|nr:hypothetical protein [Kiritimatiellia bacterium]